MAELLVVLLGWTDTIRDLKDLKPIAYSPFNKLPNSEGS